MVGFVWHLGCVCVETQWVFWVSLGFLGFSGFFGFKWVIWDLDLSILALFVCMCVWVLRAKSVKHPLFCHF